MIAISYLPKRSFVSGTACVGGPIKISSAIISCPQQASRYEADAWEENIAAYIESKSKVTVGEVARDALRIETPRIGTADQRRIAAALETIEMATRATRWQDRLARQAMVGAGQLNQQPNAKADVDAPQTSAFVDTRSHPH